MSYLVLRGDDFARVRVVGRPAGALVVAPGQTHADGFNYEHCDNRARLASCAKALPFTWQ